MTFKQIAQRFAQLHTGRFIYNHLHTIANPKRNYIHVQIIMIHPISAN
jgi:hypothetical protein